MEQKGGCDFSTYGWGEQQWWSVLLNSKEEWAKKWIRGRKKTILRGKKSLTKSKQMFIIGKISVEPNDVVGCSCKVIN